MKLRNTFGTARVFNLPKGKITVKAGALFEVDDDTLNSAVVQGLLASGQLIQDTSHPEDSKSKKEPIGESREEVKPSKAGVEVTKKVAKKATRKTAKKSVKKNLSKSDIKNMWDKLKTDEDRKRFLRRVKTTAPEHYEYFASL